MVEWRGPPRRYDNARYVNRIRTHQVLTGSQRGSLPPKNHDFCLNNFMQACSTPRTHQIQQVANVDTNAGGRRSKRKRLCMLALGPVVIILSPVVGLIPGPGGLIVLAVGLGLILRNSRLAKRGYVRMKRRWPRVGQWLDRGMRRPSYFRRRRSRQAESLP